MQPYTRLLDKKKKPTQVAIVKTLGEESALRLAKMEARLKKDYTLKKELRFPFGDTYGWGYKYMDGRKQLAYVFFEEGAFTATLDFGDDAAVRVAEILDSLQSETRTQWENRYRTGAEGGRFHVRVLSDATMEDVLRLIRCKAAPGKP